MSTEFDIDAEYGLKIKLRWKEDLNKGKVEWYNPFTTTTKGTLELGYEAGINEDYQHLGGPF